MITSEYHHYVPRSSTGGLSGSLGAAGLVTTAGFMICVTVVAGKKRGLQCAEEFQSLNRSDRDFYDNARRRQGRCWL